MTDRAIKLFGTKLADAKSRTLTAGPLSALLSNGALRAIRYHGVEVLRGIAYLVRDQNWGTYAPAIENLKVRQSAHGFSVSYHATCRDAAQAISYDARIEATADGALSFSAIATPASDFRTNRTGFVVLHPLDGVVGKPVEILHTDDKKEKARFPDLISPGQPVFEIRALRHTVMPGVTATVLMEGNKFEMEDHRNWMDASYKTYVCSLLDPWPYTLARGEAFSQSIRLSFAGQPAADRRGGAAKPITIAVGKPGKRMPLIGVAVPMAEAEAALAQADLLAAAGPGHLVCQIDGRQPGAAEAAAAFQALKLNTGAPVHLEIVLPAREPAAREMAVIADAVRRGGLTPDAVIVTQMHDLKSFQPNTPRPPGPDFAEMAAAARAEFPGAALGGGMLSYFTELNRKRPPQGVFDFITHSVCPIVHAADDLSVMETLEALASLIRSTRAIIGKSSYHIGPSSIAARDNPYGAASAPNPEGARICLADFDPRQRGLYGAAWTLGLIAGFAAGGVNALAAGAATGKTGMIGPGVPTVYPVYHVIAGMAAARGCRRLATVSSGGNRVAALGFAAKTGPQLWLANLTGAVQAVKVTGMAGKAALTRLNTASYERAIKGQDLKAEIVKRIGALELEPYEVAWFACNPS